MADALGKLGHRVLFLSAVGDDDNGHLVTNCNSMIDSTGFTKSTGSTSSAFVILGHAGDCKLVACDLSAHKFVTAEHVSKFEAAIKRSPMVVMDANIPLETMNKMAAICTTNRVPNLREHCPGSLFVLYTLLNTGHHWLSYLEVF
ncbi:hypothetical protein HDE_01541 [Halotydeus destructor]|nr:hypothetical protein HDE_01541 [Halotydeus destructor]